MPFKIGVSLNCRPQRKLREGDVFTSVCDSVHRGACMAGGVSGGAYMTGGGLYGMGHVWQGRCVWQGAICGKGACMAGGTCGRGVCVQEKRPLKRAVRILLECILVYFSAYTQFDNCLGTSLDGCQKLVLAIFEGMDNLFDHICGPGKEGIFCFV